MDIELCKWKYGKQAPVVLMIDDFANKYMMDRDEGKYLGSDWGGRCYKKNGLYEILQERLLKQFPYLRITMFLVVGRREELIPNGKKSVSLPIDANKEFSEFLTALANNSSYEIAYHGLNHGKIVNGFLKQEWMCFKSLAEAKNTIKTAVSMYEETTSKKFMGGKYCGYEYNNFSDQSIIDSGFEWWCRHWDGEIFLGSENPEYSLELQNFGGVVDIPSTVDGSIFSTKNPRTLFSKGFIKGLYYQIKYGITIEQILDSLITHSQIINIQEHSSPMREDEKRQQPNIIDDLENIIYILRYLSSYDLWYATCHEIAEYFNVYRRTKISMMYEGIRVDSEGKQEMEISFDITGNEIKRIKPDNRIINVVERNSEIIYTAKIKPGSNVFAYE